MTAEFNVENHFENKSPVVREIYDSLIKKVKSFGKLQEEPPLRVLQREKILYC